MAAPQSAAPANFTHSIINLLKAHPLYRYCTAEDDSFRLSVLLIGSSERLIQLRNMILSHGQLLNTALEVTVVTEDLADAEAQLLKEAPELGRFLLIRGLTGVPDCEWELGTLTYEENKSIREALSAILASHSRYRYVLIDGEYVTEAVKALPSGSERFIAWIDGDTIRTCGNHSEAFPPELDANLSEEIKDIAYRIHSAYEKGADPRKTDREIRESFENPYNYASNVECAIHVRSKIWSAGIDPDDPDFAERFARTFNLSIQTKQSLWQDLAQLEHRRWCISKLAKGFRQAGVEHICQAPGETSHNAEQKRHACLVRYGKKGPNINDYHPRLSDDNWAEEDPDRLSGLDPLDLQTLRIHKRCGELLEERLDSCLAILDELDPILDEDLLLWTDRLRGTMEQMRARDRDAVYRYQEQLHDLHQLMRQQGLDTGKEILDRLIRDMTVPVEYLLCKDYKEVNFDIIRQIALYSHKIPALVKLMCDEDWECIHSAYHFRPDRLIFLNTADTVAELGKIRQQALRLDSFLRDYCPGMETAYHIFLIQKPHRSTGNSFQNISPLKKEQPELFTGWNCHVYSVDSPTSDSIPLIFGNIMRESRATAIDTTNGKHVFISPTEDYARLGLASAFVVTDQEIRNLRGAQIIDRIVLDNGFSVQELFDLAKAQKIKQDAAALSDVFLRQYQQFWEIASNPKTWYRFCQSVSDACQDSRIDREKLAAAFTQEAEKVVRKKDSPSEAEKKREEMLRSLQAITSQLADAGILISDPENQFYTISCPEVLSSLRNPGKVLEYFIYCTVGCSDLFRDAVMSWFFRHGDAPNSAKNEIDVICTHQNAALFISAKHVSEKSFDAEFLQKACMQVHWLAHRFGGPNPKPILAAPVVQVYDEQGKMDVRIQRARDWGVYLLGRECFEKGRLPLILDAIARETRQDEDPLHWCKSILPQPAPVS